MTSSVTNTSSAMQIPACRHGPHLRPTQDTETSQKVARHRQDLAGTRFPNVNPIGRHFHIGGADSPWDLEVIGIVKDVKVSRVSPNLSGPTTTSITYNAGNI